MKQKLGNNLDSKQILKELNLILIDIPPIKKGHNMYYTVECNNCGKIYLKSKCTFLRSKCQCYKAVKGAYNFKGYGNVSMRYYNRLKRYCKKRNQEFSISLEYLWKVYLSQNGKCALSGIDIPLLKNPKTKAQRESQLASVDRINSSIGYIEGNVQWVHKDINLMKNKFDQNYFIKMCKKISKNGITSNKSKSK